MSEVFSPTPDVWAECVRSSEGNRFFNEIIQICSNTSQQLGYKPPHVETDPDKLTIEVYADKEKNGFIMGVSLSPFEIMTDEEEGTITMICTVYGVNSKKGSTITFFAFHSSKNQTFSIYVEEDENGDPGLEESSDHAFICYDKNGAQLYFIGEAADGEQYSVNDCYLVNYFPSQGDISSLQKTIAANVERIVFSYYQSHALTNEAVSGVFDKYKF